MRKRQNQNLSRSVLKNKIERDLFIVGKNSVIEIFGNHYDNFECLIAPENLRSSKSEKIIDLFRSKNVPIFFDSGLIEFTKETIGISSIGVVVLLKRQMEQYLSLREIKQTLESMKTCTVVAIPDVEYEQNLGNMIRTCLGLGADFLLVPNRQQKVFGSTVTKVSMGYNFVLPVVRENFLLAIDELKTIGFEVVGIDMGGENILDFRYNPKACFVMGRESTGLTDTVRSKCDTVLSIPMSDVVESLNVSTSLGIALYDRMHKLNKEI